MTTPITLTPEELAQLTGGATLPHVQVRRLRAAGYARARLVNGCAIVERAHAEWQRTFDGAALQRRGCRAHHRHKRSLQGGSRIERLS